MAFEKSWDSIPPRLFSADGKQSGEVPLLNSKGFKVGMIVNLSSDSYPTPIQLKVKRVIGNSIFLGRIDKPINDRVDISQYVLADNPVVWATEQEKSKVPFEDRDFATFEHEPANARRGLLVDELGVPYSTENPLPTTATIAGDVTIGTDGYNQAAPDSMNITGSENGTKTGIKHGIRIDSDLDTRVGISDGANKAEVDSNRKLSVKDTTAHTIQSAIYNLLLSGIIKVDDDASQTLLTSILTQLQTGGISIGTEDGTTTGTQHVFVNNMKLMILDSADRVESYTYADFGTKDSRITRIDYTSATFPGVTARKNFNFVLDGNSYRRTTTVWSLV